MRWPSCKEGAAEHRLAPEGTWRVLLFKGSGPNPLLSISLANAIDRSVVILGLVGKGTPESDLSLALQLR